MEAGHVILEGYTRQVRAAEAERWTLPEGVKNVLQELMTFDLSSAGWVGIIWEEVAELDHQENCQVSFSSYAVTCLPPGFSAWEYIRITHGAKRKLNQRKFILSMGMLSLPGSVLRTLAEAPPLWGLPQLRWWSHSLPRAASIQWLINMMPIPLTPNTDNPSQGGHLSTRSLYINSGSMETPSQLIFFLFPFSFLPEGSSLSDSQLPGEPNRWQPASFHKSLSTVGATAWQA